MFEKKFKLSKEDSVDLKGALKRLEEKNYDEEIQEATENLTTVRKRMLSKKNTCNKLKSKLVDLEGQCSETESKIDSIPAEIIDIAKINKSIRTKENQLTSLNLKISEDESTLKIKQDLYKKIIDFLSDFDLDEFESLSQQIADKRMNLKVNESELNKLLDKHSDIIKKEKLLNGIPCGTSYPTCKFDRDWETGS